MLGDLRTAAEEHLGHGIYYALAACPNLVALYREDIEDAFEYLLTVLYTKNALCVEASVMQSAYAYYPYSTSPPSMDFNLGSQALHDNPDEDKSTYEGVFLLGDNIRGNRFRAVMEDALKSIVGYVPDVYDADPVFSAARGVVEFARRGGFLWNYGCVHEASEANPLSWRKA